MLFKWYTCHQDLGLNPSLQHSRVYSKFFKGIFAQDVHDDVHWESCLMQKVAQFSFLENVSSLEVASCWFFVVDTEPEMNKNVWLRQS